MSIRRGDLVYVAVSCNRHPDCSNDFGMLFQVGETTCANHGAVCNLCDVQMEPGSWLVRHPAYPQRGQNGWIPFSFLKKINPPGTQVQKPQREEVPA